MADIPDIHLAFDCVPGDDVMETLARFEIFFRRVEEAREVIESHFAPGAVATLEFVGLGSRARNALIHQGLCTRAGVIEAAKIDGLKGVRFLGPKSRAEVMTWLRKMPSR